MSAYCDDCEADTRADCDHGGCECCCDSRNAHDAALEREWAEMEACTGYSKMSRAQLEACDPRPVSAEQMAEWQRLK